jgi:hypothetical protein
MATTTYHVQKLDQNENVEELGTKSKKQTAVDLARAERKASGARVRVVTDAGNVVFEQAAKKAIKMSPKYTRTVVLPDGFELPDGMRACYFRPRRNGVILHDPENGVYHIANATTGELLEDEFETTREAGARLKSGV